MRRSFQYTNTPHFYELADARETAICRCFVKVVVHFPFPFLGGMRKMLCFFTRVPAQCGLSCHRTCHKDCSSILCEFTQCEYCAISWSRYSGAIYGHMSTHANSELCVAAQRKEIGCHSCARRGCWSLSPLCYGLCTAASHVCGSGPDGCESCGRLCHSTCADARCSFTAPRGVLQWDTDARQLLDVQASDGSHPHMIQLEWRFDIPTHSGRPTVIVNDLRFYVGVGNIGKADDGEWNNCLIDSIRQCLGVEVSSFPSCLFLYPTPSDHYGVESLKKGGP